MICHSVSGLENEFNVPIALSTFRDNSVSVLEVDRSQRISVLEVDWLQRISVLEVDRSQRISVSEVDRSQRISVRGCFSDELVRNTGLLGGCVIYPVLLLIY